MKDRIVPQLVERADIVEQGHNQEYGSWGLFFGR